MNWLILVLLASLPLGHLTRIELGSGIALYFHDLLAALMSFLVLIRSIKQRKLPQAQLTKPILAFILVAAISLLVGLSKLQPEPALPGCLYLVRWTALSGIYFYLLQYSGIRKNLKLFGKTYSLQEALLMSGLALAAFGLLQYALFPDLTQLKWLGWDDHLYRLTGTILDPGFTGILLVLTTFLALGIKLQPAVKIVAISLPITALFLTYSRASYLAFLLGLLVFVAIKKKLKKGFIVGCLFLAVLLFLPRAESEGTNLLRVYSLFQRIETWNQAVVIAKNNPLFGVGFNLLRQAKLEYGFLGEDWETSHSASGIDNSYLFVLATTGVVGLIFYLKLLCQMLNLFLKNKSLGSQMSSSGLASLTAVSIHALFNNTWFYPWVMIWTWYLLATVETLEFKKEAYSS